MFSKIRRRLTFLYSGIMGVFLLGFVIAAFTGLTGVVYWKEKQEVTQFAEEEAREQAALMKHPQLQEQPPEEEDEHTGKDIAFVYAFDNSGRLVSTEGVRQSFKEIIIAQIKNWKAPYGQVVMLTIDGVNGENAIVMMESLPIVYCEESLGEVYVGRDVTSYYHMLKTYVSVLAGVSIVFLLLATGGGHAMAGRSIVPIKKSYDRQRQFVADASHELRTPLSVLMASVDAIQGDEGNKISPFTRQVLDDMKDELRKATKIVTDMLTLARADATAVSILKENFDLTPVAEQVIRSLQPLAKEKGVQLRLSRQNEVLIVADKERIRQLFLILLDNGVKYTPPGGEVLVDIEFTTQTPQEVKIIVQDSGIGIPLELQGVIFERFYRVDKTRSREFGGSGLGLAIAKWIVDAHSGAIRVSDGAEQGTIFTVVLPQ